MRAGAALVSPSKIWRETSLWTGRGLGIAILAGVLLFSIDPELYYENLAFRWKMLALMLALGFYYTVVRRAALRDRPSPIAGLISLVLFALVPLGGIFIGYSL
jgi:hypothetical protein